MSDDTDFSRRRFLKVTTGAASTITVAGCGGGGGDGGATSTPTQTQPPETTTQGQQTTTESGPAVNLDKWPYAANETDIEGAKQVMEEAGYGPNNRYSLDWLQYTSKTWKEMANTIRSRLEAAYIDMSITEADFGSLLKKTANGEHEANTLGWIADYPGSRNFLQLIDPPNTMYGTEGASPNGARLFWTEDAKADPKVRQFMVEQFDRIQNNPEPTEQAQQIVNDAAVKMEEGMWASCCMIPVYHRLDEVFWYDNVDYRPYGPMGGSRQKSNIGVSSISGKNRLDLIEATFNTLDPIASGNTASGDVLMDVFDAPMNYVNGTTEVEGLLVESYQVSDDLKTYSFKLKEGVPFHGDWGEVTAADVVYSLRRLVESKNSTNTYFPISVMGIVHDTDDQGNVVPDSTGVRQTGEYTFEVELQAPFGFALSVLAYGAFSIVPENIVGDIEGYDGEMKYSRFSSKNPIGCGPFTFQKWEPGSGGEVNVDTFDDYHGEVASFDGVDRAIITEDSAIYNYFINQNADISGIPTTQYDPSLVSVEDTLEAGQQVGTYGPLENDKTVNYAGIPTVSTFHISFNMQKVPTAVRQAMAYVINRKQFVDSVFKGRGAPAFHLQPQQIYPGGAEAYEAHWKGG